MSVITAPYLISHDIAHGHSRASRERQGRRQIYPRREIEQQTAEADALSSCDQPVNGAMEGSGTVVRSSSIAYISS